VKLNQVQRQRIAEAFALIPTLISWAGHLFPATVQRDLVPLKLIPVAEISCFKPLPSKLIGTSTSTGDMRVGNIKPDRWLKIGEHELHGNTLLLPTTEDPNTLSQQKFFGFQNSDNPNLENSILKICKFIDPRSNGYELRVINTGNMKPQQILPYHQAQDSTPVFLDAAQRLRNPPPKKQRVPNKLFATLPTIWPQ
jgi:hypothetical protein